MRKKSQAEIVLPVPVKAGFSGRVLVHVENGEYVRQTALREDEFFGSLESFLDTARMAGYQVIPPAV